MSPTETRGYSASKDQLLGRLNRIEGRWEASGGWSRRIATASTSSPRSAAVRAALDKVALGLLDEHARNCVVQAPRPSARGHDRRVDGGRRPSHAPRLTLPRRRRLRRVRTYLPRPHFALSQRSLRKS